MSNKLVSTDQKDLMREAFKKLKEAFPTDGIQVSFNLSPKHTNMNYNIKASGMDVQEK